MFEGQEIRLALLVFLGVVAYLFVNFNAKLTENTEFVPIIAVLSYLAVVKVLKIVK